MAHLTNSRAHAQAMKAHMQANFCSVPFVCQDPSAGGTMFDDSACVALQPNELAALPTLTARLNGTVDLAITPAQYMTKIHSQDTDYYCLMVYR
jgi:hypothetical protein